MRAPPCPTLACLLLALVVTFTSPGPVAISWSDFSLADCDLVQPTWPEE
jgi:hypothetical protein